MDSSEKNFPLIQLGITHKFMSEFRLRTFDFRKSHNDVLFPQSIVINIKIILFSIPAFE